MNRKITGSQRKEFEKRSTGANGAFKKRGLALMTERQLEAYFLSRDALRRIQRTSSQVAKLAFSTHP